MAELAKGYLTKWLAGWPYYLWLGPSGIQSGENQGIQKSRYFMLPERGACCTYEYTYLSEMAYKISQNPRSVYSKTAEVLDLLSLSSLLSILGRKGWWNAQIAEMPETVVENTCKDLLEGLYRRAAGCAWFHGKHIPAATCRGRWTGVRFFLHTYATPPILTRI